MNKEIKFRAWDKKDKVIREVTGINFLGKDMWLKYDKDHLIGANFLFAELMQYTGLKDKNGKDIYEGDIFKESNSIGIVIYDEDGFRIKWYKDEDFYNNVLKIHHNHLEVIGNVYENPELLK